MVFSYFEHGLGTVYIFAHRCRTEQGLLHNPFTGTWLSRRFVAAVLVLMSLTSLSPLARMLPGKPQEPYEYETPVHGI
jgi:hypothetical protein